MITTNGSNRELLIVFTKPSVPGSVKTRLVPPLSYEEAAFLNTAFTLDTVARQDVLDRNIRLQITSGDTDEGTLSGEVLKRFPAVEMRLQKGDGLGRRLLNAFEEAFDEGFRSVVVLGSDHPNLPCRYVSEAFERLASVPAGRKAVVLGPTTDGGYYLIGMNRPVPEAFEGMTYSHDRVLEDTVRRIRPSGARVELLNEWYDVDDENGLLRLVRDLQYGSQGELPFTVRLLDRIGMRGLERAELSRGGP